MSTTLDFDHFRFDPHLTRSHSAQVVDRLNEVLRHDGDRAMRAVGLVGGMSEARQRRLLSYRCRF